MFRVVTIEFEDLGYPLFIADTNTGYTAKDLLSVPGAYDEVNGETPFMFLNPFKGNIGSYKTNIYGLVCDTTAISEEVQDMTQIVSQLLTLPEVAAKTLIQNYDEEIQNTLNTAIETIHYCESITTSSRICLPKEAFKVMPEDEAEKMLSKRTSYILKNIDNVEIVAKQYNSKFAVSLPSIEEIHASSGALVSASDILRVIAPYRREISAGVYSYQGIYHTPYFKVDPKIRGMVPQHLNWLTGRTSNDTLGVQPNERHMMNNLMTLISADISNNIQAILTGIVLNTPIGGEIRKLITCRNLDLIPQQVNNIRDKSTENISCSITYDDLKGIIDNMWDVTEVSQLIGFSLVINPAHIKELIQNHSNGARIIDCDNLPFIVQFDDEYQAEMTEILISKGFLTRAMYAFLMQLCYKAYEVNWGHTGATRAIPSLVVPTSIESVNEIMGNYLSQMLGKGAPVPPEKLAMLYSVQSLSTDDDDYSESEDEDELSIDFEYYITKDTMMKIINNALPEDFFTSPPTGAETTEMGVVEYWRKVNGENRLHYFISSSYIQTGDPKTIIECFLKLMRWGEVKPKLLVLQDNPEIRVVFDLNLGYEVANTALVDEQQLVLVNGCSYSFRAPVYLESESSESEKLIVGFYLVKDYGVEKGFLASWSDLYEMTQATKIDIAEFQSITPIEWNSNMLPLEELHMQGCELVSSEKNIERAVELKTSAKELSDLNLLCVPNILNSADFLKSLKRETILTITDRKYQILHVYMQTVRKFNKLYSNELSDVKNTVALVKLATLFWELNNELNEDKPEHNSVVADAAIKSMNLMGTRKVYNKETLTGKFIIISDELRESTIAPIEFTDPSLQQVSIKTRNRIVLLLLETDNKYIFCRKDLKPNELMISGGNISRRKYSQFIDFLNELSEGKDKFIKDSGGVKKPAVLHETVQDYL